MKSIQMSACALPVEEADLPYFTGVYKSLKGNFSGPTKMSLTHIEDDTWEFILYGLTTREWVEYCAYVYAELPSANPENTAAEFLNETTFEEGAGESEPDTEESENEEENEEYSDLSDTPAGQEVRRKLVTVKRKISQDTSVIPTGDKAVTIEEG